MNESNEILRILVVDDSAVSRKLAEFAFSGKPYEVFFADSGQQALKLLAIHHPDVVITDWMMPGLSGLELCQMIRNKLNCRDTYLILLPAIHERTTSPKVSPPAPMATSPSRFAPTKSSPRFAPRAAS